MIAEAAAPPPDEKLSPASVPRTKRAASDRVARARKLLAKWSSAAESNQRKADKALAAGEHEKAAKLVQASKRALKLALRQAKKIEKYDPIAGQAKRADRVLGKAGPAQKRWTRDRDREGRKARGSTKRARLETVASAYGSGFDRIERVTDTVAALRRRRLLGQHELQAAERYRDAYAIASGGGMTGTLDPDKGGSGGGSKIPSDKALWAGEVLNEAHRLLGKLDGAVVRQVVGEGLTLDEYARTRHGGNRAPQWAVRLVGHRLKEALKALADEWFPPARRRVRTHRDADARPTMQGGFRGSFEPGRVAHASRQGVDFSEPKENEE